MPRYKRTRDEAELDHPVEPEVALPQSETLTTLRNMWEFASLMQYIFLFGQVVKIDEDFDIEDLEAECLKPTASDRLAHIGLQLLKYVSSHRGLTPEIFDEYTRRQYVAKAPQRNPFGDEEEPLKFNDLDIFTRIRVLQQLSTWTLGNAERIRGMMPQEEDHLNWRMEPLGWDKEDRAYFVLDDNRMYRRSDEPLPPPTPKPKAKPKPKSRATKNSRSRGTRASKRRKVEDTEDEEPEEQAEDQDETMADDTVMTNGEQAQQEEESGYGFTSKTWECVAITLEEYQDFMANIFRSRDPNEKQLRARIEQDVLPIIERRAEAIRQKQLKKVRELENLQKMATAKRSSRLAGKAEKEKEEREAREVEDKRQRDLQMAREEQDRQKRIEEGHESRRLTREQRVREREAKRILHEEELAKLEEDGERAESQDVEDAAEAKRASQRQRLTQKEQHKKELEKLAEDDGSWYFDCSVCGKHGEDMDDGTHSIACDTCNVWQHSKCHGFSPKQAESDGFVFVCATCKRKEEDAKKPKIPPLKLHNRASASPETQKASSRPPTANGQQAHRLPDHVARQLDGLTSSAPRPSPGPFAPITNGPSLSPHGQAQGPPGYRYPPVANFAPNAPQQQWQGSPLPPGGRPPSGYAGPPQNGYSPAHHQQHHQYSHQAAVASSGGHPGYYQHYAPQPNSYGPQAPMYPMAHPSQQQHYYPPPQQHYGQHPPQHPPQRPGSSQLMNGFQSPTKVAPKPASSSPPPPQQHIQPHGAQQGAPQGYSQQPPQQQAQRLQQSPRTNLPPPTESYQRGPAQSPIKSSPPPHQQPTTTYQRPSPHPPHLTQTPNTAPPPPANGYQSNNSTYRSQQFQTPQQMAPSGSNGAANADQVAADGMSGPWPEGSKAIPQKHDQSPAPPSSAHSIGEKKIFPPQTPLVPSPHQQAAGATGSVPVKKLPEAPTTLPPRPPSHPEMETQAQQQVPPPAPPVETQTQQ